MPFLKRGTCTVGLKMVSTLSSQDSGVNLWKNNNQMTSTEFVEISVTVLFTTLTDHCALLELLINHISMLIQTPSLRTSVYWNLMISICFNWANLCILAKIHSYLQGLITISPKAINSILTKQEILRPTFYCKTLKKFSPFFQGPKVFNSLDNEVVNSPSLSSCKKKLKIKLLSKYENSSKIFPSWTFCHLFLTWC